MTSKETSNLGIKERLNGYLAEKCQSRAKATPLTGDASDRQYFRLLIENQPSQVLALYKGPVQFDSLPFVNVAKLFSKVPIRVPRILDHSDHFGILALEDLGDMTLQAYLKKNPQATHNQIYKQAVSVINVLQQRGKELTSNNYVPFNIAFDEKTLAAELDFFTKHFIESYQGASLTTATKNALTKEYQDLVVELACEPRVLCHRDYHSRNLMLHQDQLYVIDFQDARLGPETYDLVSLLRDSYWDVSENQVNELISYFLSLQQTSNKKVVPQNILVEFRRKFDLMALQRNLKALGTFGFQKTVRGNSSYVQHIPRTLGYIRSNLARYPRFLRLRDLLSDHCKELR
jgi:aminoglycoside/choline kinase family phosphotransferase